MASHSERQYRPVSTNETSTDDALSVRIYNDMADGINNAHYHACCHKLRSSVCFPHWSSWDNYTAQHVIAVFSPIYVPDGYSDFLFTIGHYRSAGSGSIIWRLKSSMKPYTGTIEEFDGSYLSTDAWSTTVTTTEDSHEIEHGFLNQPTTLAGGEDVFFVLTAQNSNGTTRGAITTLDIKPVFQA
jgi:hypothetical protein